MELVPPSSEELSPSGDVGFARPTATSTYYLLIRRRPREVFGMSSLFVGADIDEAKKTVVETVFGVGFPNTDDELLERYNLEVVELDDLWERKLNTFAEEQERCPPT